MQITDTMISRPWWKSASTFWSRLWESCREICIESNELFHGWKKKKMLISGNTYFIATNKPSWPPDKFFLLTYYLLFLPSCVHEWWVTWLLDCVIYLFQKTKNHYLRWCLYFWITWITDSINVSVILDKQRHTIIIIFGIF